MVLGRFHSRLSL